MNQPPDQPSPLQHLPLQASPIQQWEVEQKFHLHDAAGLNTGLAQLGFVTHDVELHHDTYWQHPARDFRQSDEALRLRRVNNLACITYKGPRNQEAALGDAKSPSSRPGGAQPDGSKGGGSNLAESIQGGANAAAIKTREEIELNIDAEQFPQWLLLLERLGFQPQPSVIKRRSLYRCEQGEWQGVVVAVDSVEQLGEFVELELLVSSRDQLGLASARIATLAARLGLNHPQPKSYLTQLLERLRCS